MRGEKNIHIVDYKRNYCKFRIEQADISQIVTFNKSRYMILFEKFGTVSIYNLKNMSKIVETYNQVGSFMSELICVREYQSSSDRLKIQYMLGYNDGLKLMEVRLKDFTQTGKVQPNGEIQIVFDKKPYLKQQKIQDIQRLAPGYISAFNIQHPYFCLLNLASGKHDKILYYKVQDMPEDEETTFHSSIMIPEYDHNKLPFMFIREEQGLFVFNSQTNKIFQLCKSPIDEVGFRNGLIIRRIGTKLRIIMLTFDNDGEKSFIYEINI
eukprot:403351140